MAKVNYNNILDDEEIYEGELNFFYLKDKSELAEFIDKYYKGRIEYINKIPLKHWFLYHIDDSGDYTYDDIILIENYQKSLLKTILETSALYKFISENCKL